MSYPLVLTNLQRLRCVVVGGGSVAERKVADLLAGGARPVVISPLLTPQLAAWVALGQIEHVQREAQLGDLEGAALALLATDNPVVNATLARSAPPGCLVNVADAPTLGSFHTVASVRRGDLLLTVSTNGQSPTLSAQIRSELAQQYGPEYVRVVQVFQRWRKLINRRLRQADRRRFWRQLRQVLLDDPDASADALVVSVLAQYDLSPAAPLLAAGK